MAAAAGTVPLEKKEVIKNLYESGIPEELLQSSLTLKSRLSLASYKKPEFTTAPMNLDQTWRKNFCLKACFIVVFPSFIALDRQSGYNRIPKC